MKAIKKFGIQLASLALLGLVLALPMYSAMAEWKGVDTPDDLPDADNPSDLIINIIKWILTIVGAVVVAAIVYSGTMMMIKANEPDERKKFSGAITFELIGLVITLLAFAIVNAMGKNITNNLTQ